MFGSHNDFEPDWLLIVHEEGRQGFETFQLVFLRSDGAARDAQGGAETLMAAKGQAHAELGVEYVEWEVCDIDILDADNSVHWERGLPEGELRAGCAAE